MFGENFEVENTKIDGCFIVRDKLFVDHRGSISSLYANCLVDKDKKYQFNHIKIAKSCLGVLRGIHGDYSSGKLVSCLYGSVYQVVVDFRPNSYSFRNILALPLNSNEAIFIPPGCGNAFQSLSDETIYLYALSYKGAYNDANEQFTYNPLSEELKINWPLTPILSDRDKNAENIQWK